MKPKTSIEKPEWEDDCSPMTCSVVELANRLRHAADDYPGCNYTLIAAAVRITRMSESLHFLLKDLAQMHGTKRKQNDTTPTN